MLWLCLLYCREEERERVNVYTHRHTLATATTLAPTAVDRVRPRRAQHNNNCVVESQPIDVGWFVGERGGRGGRRGREIVR